MIKVLWSHFCVLQKLEHLGQENAVLLGQLIDNDDKYLIEVLKLDVPLSFFAL
jgi:hypothetical protein